MLEQLVSKIAQSVESTLRTHGKAIIGQQLVTKRLADSAMEVFVAMCVLSRITSLMESKGAAACQDEHRIAKVFVQYVSNRVHSYLKNLTDNADKDLCGLADSVLAEGRYRWDVI